MDEQWQGRPVGSYRLHGYDGQGLWALELEVFAPAGPAGYRTTVQVRGDGVQLQAAATTGQLACWQAELGRLLEHDRDDGGGLTWTGQDTDRGPGSAWVGLEDGACIDLEPEYALVAQDDATAQHDATAQREELDALTLALTTCEDGCVVELDLDQARRVYVALGAILTRTATSNPAGTGLPGATAVLAAAR